MNLLLDTCIRYGFKYIFDWIWVARNAKKCETRIRFSHYSVITVRVDWLCCIIFGAWKNEFISQNNIQRKLFRSFIQRISYAPFPAEPFSTRFAYDGDFCGDSFHSKMLSCWMGTVITWAHRINSLVAFIKLNSGWELRQTNSKETPNKKFNCCHFAVNCGSETKMCFTKWRMAMTSKQVMFELKRTF